MVSFVNLTFSSSIKYQVRRHGGQAHPIFDAIVSPSMTPTKRLFLILWLAGMAGVLSLLMLDIPALVRALPLPEGTPPPDLPPPALLKLATIIQPAVLMSIAVVIGIWLAPKVGLHAPAAEAFANARSVWPDLKPQIIPGAIAGLLGGVAIVATWVVFKPSLPVEFVDRAQEFNTLVPHAVRFLYGGFTEEILLRWGMMSFLVWLLVTILDRKRRPDSPPRSIFFVVAILTSAFLFGFGHLPIASILAGGLTLPIFLYVIIANSIFGIIAGFLYWRRGLEAAVIAHISAHLVLITAIYLVL
jgi:hypothetical protein